MMFITTPQLQKYFVGISAQAVSMPQGIIRTSVIVYCFECFVLPVSAIMIKARNTITANSGR